ncbi:MAG: hypothetical protein OEY11_00475 [Gammaproteobacteria bacterium]|nr:hypothetical protein [Gammaproteobacteria bacterium]
MKKALSILLITLGTLQSIDASAQMLIRPRASIGVAAYELAFVDPASGSITDTSYLTLGGGITLAKGNTFFDLSVSTSLAAEHNYTQSGQTETFQRTDFAATLGYVLDSNMSVFGGFKSGRSYFEYPSSDASYMSFDSAGLFGGGSLSFRLGSDVLSFNAALALMNGSLTDNDINFSNRLNEEANTVGVSLGASYVINLSNQSGFILKGALQNYSFTNWTGNYSNTNGLSDLKETIVSGNLAYFVNF